MDSSDDPASILLEEMLYRRLLAQLQGVSEEPPAIEGDVYTELGAELTNRRLSVIIEVSIDEVLLDLEMHHELPLGEITVPDLQLLQRIGEALREELQLPERVVEAFLAAKAEDGE
jgi:hypothetical protein